MQVITTVFPIVYEIPYQDPIHLFALFNQNEWSILFDSANHADPYQNTNQYSYIAVSPFKTFILKNGALNNSQEKITDPFYVLNKYMQQFKIEKVPDLPPFQGGIAGYFSYDLCHYLEKIPYAPIDDMYYPDLAVGLYDIVISFDHRKRQAWLISTGFPEKETVTAMARANSRLKELLLVLKHKQNSILQKYPMTYCEKDISTNFNKESYMGIVRKAQEYILNGDIFEVNLSQRFNAYLQDGLNPFLLYQRLRKINPAPFAAYLNLGETILASASPERFILLENSEVETRPIKGTIRRGQSLDEDNKLAEKLINSKKDHAENVMIVDLMRNDLSRVCEDDSVYVEKLCGLESFATVHHLVSVIKGKLALKANATDLLAMTLPGGSITGAPKIRAMQIISELEPNRRGPYCGCIGYISFAGDMDTSIIIRTYAIRDGMITFQTGGAIVLDSDPEQEYQETLDKAQALNQTLMNENEPWLF